LYIDNKMALGSWKEQSPSTLKTKYRLEKGKKYNIKLEYYQGHGGALIHFDWGVSDKDFLSKSIAKVSKADVIVMVGGISSKLEGEEMTVNIPGFFGGDRTSIDLPKVQEDLLKKLKETGKPVVLVLLSGSALAVNYAAANIPAIIQAWYPGEEGGNALADILFGDYNPAGRLPITFYKSLDKLPSFTDYSMKGRTYRYFEGDVLYPFGFGLSYTTYKYSNLNIPSNTQIGENVKVSVDIENTGKMDGEEVAQLYIRFLKASVPVPFISLQGYRRLKINVGEKKHVEFALTPKQLSVINDNNERIVEPGQIEIFVGGSQPDKKCQAEKQILSGKTQLNGNILKIE